MIVLLLIIFTAPLWLTIICGILKLIFYLIGRIFGFCVDGWSKFFSSISNALLNVLKAVLNFGCDHPILFISFILALGLIGVISKSDEIKTCLGKTKGQKIYHILLIVFTILVLGPLGWLAFRQVPA